MIEVLVECLPPSPLKLTVLNKFARLLPNNSQLLEKQVLSDHTLPKVVVCLFVCRLFILLFVVHLFSFVYCLFIVFVYLFVVYLLFVCCRVVRYALRQNPVGIRLAQSLLAEYLARRPQTPHLWQL